MSGRVLVVDDDAEMTALVASALSRHGYTVHTSHSAAEALEALADQDFDVLLTDVSMHEMNGLELCSRVAANHPDLPVVMVTAFGNMELAIASIRAGAYDFVTKPFELTTLRLTVDRAVQHRSLREEVKRLRLAAAHPAGEGEVIGQSSAIRRVLDLVDRIAEADASVLITGPSGTGKDLLARALHRRSHRARGPFVAVNCAALPEGLLESELFGHVRGAFTDAKSARSGLFLRAAQGTLFLDEIGDLPLRLQPKLLRALQERVIRPLGQDTEVPVDVRLVAASNRDLDEAVQEGRFREDLFYRINVVQIELPALRNRGNDVLLLAQHFVSAYAARFGKHIQGFSRAVAERLLAYTWPGNVRELQNAVERAVALARYDELTVDDLPDKIRGYHPAHLPDPGDSTTLLATLEEVERQHIFRVLDSVAGNKTQAAQILGLDRKTLHRKLERYAGRRPTKDGEA